MSQFLPSNISKARR